MPIIKRILILLSRSCLTGVTKICEIEESVGFFTTYAVGFNGLYINGVEVKGAYKDVTIGDVMEDVLWTFRQYDGNLGDKIIYNMGIDCDFIFIMLS